MPKRIKLRTLTSEEEQEVRRLAKSRKESLRLIQRAQIIVAMLDDPDLAASRAGEQVGFKGAPMGIHWVKRFNELASEKDDRRPTTRKPAAPCWIWLCKSPAAWGIHLSYGR